MTLLAVDHVQLAMPANGEEAARTFYAGVLGLSEVEKPASLSGRGGCWFESGSVKVDDVQALEKRALASDATVKRDVALPGYERIHVFDPFGNRIEFMQRLSS